MTRTAGRIRTGWPAAFGRSWRIGSTASPAAWNSSCRGARIFTRYTIPPSTSARPISSAPAGAAPEIFSSRRSVFDEVGLFDSELISHEDSEWGLRATRAGKSLGYAPEAVVYHRARASLASLVRKWIRTEFGAAQAWRRHGLFELHLWTKKANYRPLAGTWRSFAPAVRENPHLRLTMDGISNILRLAGNLGSFLGYFNLGRRRAL